MRLFSAAAPFDQAHGVAVARRVEAELGDDPRWLRAALLHDAGKARSSFGLVARTLVTVTALAAPVVGAGLEERAVKALSGHELLDRVSVRLRPGAYLAHGPLAADWLERHGTEDEVAWWVAVHHRRELWPESPMPSACVRALAEADE